MSTPHIVDPARIEGELLKIWEELSKENTTRASLFNLVVFNRLSSRTDYVQNVVQKVLEKFPCRILFITETQEPNQNYLKTAVSVVTPNGKTSSIACDRIDIGVSGNTLSKVPFLILPHLIPDLPVYILWTEDFSSQHPLVFPFLELASRFIADSECSDHLSQFSQNMLTMKQQSRVDIADLNWARTQGWRDLIASTFDIPKRVSLLDEISSVQITFNAQSPPFFCHLKVQSLYLLAWLSSRLGWTSQKIGKDAFAFTCKGKKIDVVLTPAKWEKLGSGTVIGIEIETACGNHFSAVRIPEKYHYVKIHLASKDSCELPYEFVLGQTATGHSLVNEICSNGTSSHFLDVLQMILQSGLGSSC